MVHTVEKGLKAEQGALLSHIKVVLAGWPAGAKLAADVFEETRAFVTWLLSRIASYYTGLVGKASPENTYTGTEAAALKASCWERTLESLRGFFEELRKVRVDASAAHLAATPADVNALFLHCTLQELRVMREFKALDWAGHPCNQRSLVDHLHATYLPRSALAAQRGGGIDKRVTALETQVSSAKSTIGQLRADHTALAKRV
jgi:hypothetical protein